MKRLLAALGVWLCLCAQATAQGPEDPAPVRAAFEAAEAGNWQTAYSLVAERAIWGAT